MNLLQNPEDLDEATRAIARYAASNWHPRKFAPHALERLQLRHIPLAVVDLVLLHGTAVSVRREQNEWNELVYKYKVRWVDKFGAVNVVVVILAPMRLLVVTAFPDESDDW